jgi:hypothetical protein
MKSRRHTLCTTEFSSSCPALFVFGSNTSVSRRSSSPEKPRNALQTVGCRSHVQRSKGLSCVSFCSSTLAEQKQSHQEQNRKTNKTINALQHLEMNEHVVESQQQPRELISVTSLVSNRENAENGAILLNGHGLDPTQILRSWNQVRIYLISVRF